MCVKDRGLGDISPECWFWACSDAPTRSGVRLARPRAMFDEKKKSCSVGLWGAGQLHAQVYTLERPGGAKGEAMVRDRQFAGSHSHEEAEKYIQGYKESQVNYNLDHFSYFQHQAVQRQWKEQVFDNHQVDRTHLKYECVFVHGATLEYNAVHLNSPQSKVLESSVISSESSMMLRWLLQFVFQCMNRSSVIN